MKRYINSVANLLIVFSSILLSILFVELSLYIYYQYRGFIQLDRSQVVTADHFRPHAQTVELLNSYQRETHQRVLLFIGDSFTYGQPGIYSESYPMLMEDRLSTYFPNTLSINAGVRAANIVDYYIFLKKLLPQIGPTHVILNISSNDSIFSLWNFNPVLVCHNHKSDLDSFVFALQKHSLLFNYFYHHIYLPSLPHEMLSRRFDRQKICTQNYFQKIVTLVSSHNAKLITTYHKDTWKYEKLCLTFKEERSDILTVFRSSYGVTPILLTDGVMKESCIKSDSFYAKDNYHYTPAGYKELSDVALNGILKELSR